MNTYRVPDLQALALPLTRVGYAILAGGGEEEIKVFRLIPDRQLHLRPDALNKGRKQSPQNSVTASGRCSPQWLSHNTWFPLTQEAQAKLEAGGVHPTRHLRRPDLGPPSGSLEWLIKVHPSSDTISLKRHPACLFRTTSHPHPPLQVHSYRNLVMLSLGFALMRAHTGVHTHSGQHRPFPRLAPYYPAKSAHPEPTPPLFILKPIPYWVRSPCMSLKLHYQKLHAFL